MDLVFAMEDMERGLEEMAQSVEHMQEMLSRSPMVQALAQRKPEVRLPSALRRHQGQVILQAASSCTTCSRFHLSKSFLRTGCVHEIRNAADGREVTPSSAQVCKQRVRR